MFVRVKKKKKKKQIYKNLEITSNKKILRVDFQKIDFFKGGRK